MHSNKTVIGCEEWAGLPQLNIPTLKLRIDSGAKTSALHAVNITPFKKDDIQWVSFDVHPIQNDGRTTVHCEAPLLGKRKVKSSSGVGETRFVIKTTLSIGEDSWEVEVTLTNRVSMGYRMLLGREAMSGKMLVDPEASFLLGEPTEETLNAHYESCFVELSGLKIGILTSDATTYRNKRIVEAAQDRGHEVELLDVKSCYLKFDGETPEIHDKKGLMSTKFDAIIPNLLAEEVNYGCALLRYFEATGIYVQNSSTAIAQTRDKLYVFQKLINNGIPVPMTGISNAPLETEKLIELLGGAPVVVKLMEGNKRKEAIFAESNYEAVGLIDELKKTNVNALVQEFVGDRENKFIHCFVVNGRVVESVAGIKSSIGNQSENVKPKKIATVKITKEEKRLATVASKTMQLKVAAIDIVRGTDGLLLLKVNANPDFEKIEEVSNKDIARKMIEGIEKDLKYKKIEKK